MQVTVPVCGDRAGRSVQVTMVAYGERATQDLAYWENCEDEHGQVKGAKTALCSAGDGHGRSVMVYLSRENTLHKGRGMRCC